MLSKYLIPKKTRYCSNLLLTITWQITSTLINLKDITKYL